MSLPRRRLVAAFLAAAVAAAGCSSDGETIPPAQSRAPLTAETDVPAQSVEVLTTVDHRTDAFTQGLVWDDGVLFESAGRVGQSTLASVDPATGAVDKIVSVDPDVFAEGLAQVGDRLIQLTWKDGVAYVYDAETLEVVEEHTYDGEGWGLCHDGDRLVMSDGSAELTFHDSETFGETGDVAVTLAGDPVDRLNELECVDDRVYANVWQTETIVEIDPSSGEVTSVIDASALRVALDPPVTDPNAVLNGIAYDEDAGTFWLTGKLWPQLFEVRFVDA